ncbi:MAG: ATP-binding cassette domain-containing protein [Chloroflexi bacterium]|nr:ATP-binding cassette domain-containing protein [Chloroflexota bacterium]
MIEDYNIEVSNLTKRYRDGFVAVNEISFTVKAGEIYGFLGPNGAGKSTTVNMLTTRIQPTSGHALVAGYDVCTKPQAVRRVSGVALQEIGIDPLMTAQELLTLQARLFGFNRVEAHERSKSLLDTVRLSTAASKPVGSYSGGMRRRLDLALALIHKPRILFLDEPTTGLDPASRRDIWAEVRRLNREQGMTIFLTTQYLEEADMLADRVGIINHGELVIEGQPAALKAAMGTEVVNITFAEAYQAQQAQQVLATTVQQSQTENETLYLYLNDAASNIASIVSALNDISLQPQSLTITQPTLDDVFLKVTGQTFELLQPSEPS